MPQERFDLSTPAPESLVLSAAVNCQRFLGAYELPDHSVFRFWLVA